MQPPARRPRNDVLQAAGWTLLALFSILAARAGSTGETAFELAWFAGYAGYLLLVLHALRGTGTAQPRGFRSALPTLLACIALRIPLLTMTPSDDLYRYAWEGRVQNAGLNPYAHAPDDPALAHLRNADWSRINHPDYPAIYPPLTQLTFRAATACGATAIHFKYLHAAWDALTVLLLAMLIALQKRHPGMIAVYAACPLTLAAFSIEGHVESLMLVWLAVAWLSIERGRERLAGAAVGLAIAAKIVPVILVPYMLRHHPKTILPAVIALLLVSAPYLAEGHTLGTSLVRFAGGTTFFSFPGTILQLPMNHPWTRPALAAIAVGAISYLAWKKRPFDIFARRALTTTLLVMPVVHYWYLCPLWMFMTGRPALPWLLAGGVMGLYFRANQGPGSEWTVPGWVAPLFWSTLVATAALTAAFSRAAAKPAQAPEPTAE